MRVDLNLRTVFFEEDVTAVEEPVLRRVIPEGRYWVVELGERVALIRMGGGVDWIEMEGEMLLDLWSLGQCKVGAKVKPRLRF